MIRAYYLDHHYLLKDTEMASSRLPMPRSAFRNKARDSMYPVNPPARDAVRTEPTAPTLNPFLADCLKAFEACNKSVSYPFNYKRTEGLSNLVAA